MGGLAILLLGALHADAALRAAPDSGHRQHAPPQLQQQTAFAFVAAHREAAHAVRAGLPPASARQASAFAGAAHLRHCGAGRVLLTYADSAGFDSFLRTGLLAELGRQAGGAAVAGAMEAGLPLGLDPRPHLPPGCLLPADSVWLLAR